MGLFTYGIQNFKEENYAVISFSDAATLFKIKQKLLKLQSQIGMR